MLAYRTKSMVQSSNAMTGLAPIYSISPKKGIDYLSEAGQKIEEESFTFQIESLKRCQPSQSSDSSEELRFKLCTRTSKKHMYAKQHYLKLLVPVTCDKMRELQFHYGRICPHALGGTGLIPRYTAAGIQVVRVFSHIQTYRITKSAVNSTMSQWSLR